MPARPSATSSAASPPPASSTATTMGPAFSAAPPSTPFAPSRAAGPPRATARAVRRPGQPSSRRLRTRRPTAVPPLADAARRRRRRAAAPARPPRLRRRPGRRHLRPERYARRSLETSSATSASTADGICGPDTLRGVAPPRRRGPTRRRRWPRCARTSGCAHGAPHPGRPAHRRRPSRRLSALVRAMWRSRCARPARRSSLLDHPDGSAQASRGQPVRRRRVPRASRGAPERHVGRVLRRPRLRVGGWTPTGRARRPELLGTGPAWTSASTSGMRLPVLRETRMPAVLCELGPVRVVVDRPRDVSSAVADAVVRVGLGGSARSKPQGCDRLNSAARPQAVDDPV